MSTPSTAMAAQQPEQLLARVQALQARIEGQRDPAVRRMCEELVDSIVAMYGCGLQKILDALLHAGAPGERVASEISDDPLVATLLLIHDLHPVSLDDRVHQALERVRPYMESHGGNVELLSLEHGVARMRLHGTCSGCSASSVTLELAIKRALEELAPDLEGLEVEGVAAPGEQGASLPMLGDTELTCIELPVINPLPLSSRP